MTKERVLILADEFGERLRIEGETMTEKLTERLLVVWTKKDPSSMRTLAFPNKAERNAFVIGPNQECGVPLNEQEAHLDRQANLHAAFQLGKKAASQGNVEDARTQFLEQYGVADTEAANLFDLGVGKALAGRE